MTARSTSLSTLKTRSGPSASRVSISGIDLPTIGAGSCRKPRARPTLHFISL
jgi:hypothetical protein